MTSRERVLATFAREPADRVPAWFGASPEFMAKARGQLGAATDEEVRLRFRDDFRRVAARFGGPARRSPDQGLAPGLSCRTVFGVEHQGIGCGIPLNPPLAGASLEDIVAYEWPKPEWIDVSQVRAQALSWKRQYAILGGDWSPFWHDANELLGMENLMCQMHDHPEIVDAVLRHAADYYLEVNRRLFEAAAGAIDIFFVGNDFGSQAGPLIGPAAFRRFVSPHLSRLASLGHDFGLKMMMHCCGSFAPLIPAMIEAGIDALQALQPCTADMQPAALKEAFGTRLVFNGGIDSHHLLIKGTPDLVRNSTRQVVEIMSRGGGYILSASHDYILEETPVENVVAMYDVARELSTTDQDKGCKSSVQHI